MAPKSVTFRRHDHLVSVLFGDLLSHSYNITFSMFLDLVKLLLFATQLFQDGKSPLMTACEGGHTETAQLLIDKGADVNKAGHVSALNIVTHNFET